MNNELYHHGIKGQKWGLRRYQNKDGSLTAEGRKHYFDGNGNLTSYGKQKYTNKNGSLNSAGRKLYSSARSGQNLSNLGQTSRSLKYKTSTDTRVGLGTSVLAGVATGAITKSAKVGAATALAGTASTLYNRGLNKANERNLNTYKSLGNSSLTALNDGSGAEQKLSNSKRTKKAVSIGIGVAGTALELYGAYKIYNIISGSNSSGNKVIDFADAGKNAVKGLNLSSMTMDDLSKLDLY